MSGRSQSFAQPPRQSVDVIPCRIPHDDGNDLDAREHALNERDLDLDRVFAAMGSLVGDAIRVRGDERGDRRLVDGCHPQGRSEAVAGEEGDQAGQVEQVAIELLHQAAHPVGHGPH